MLSSSRHFCCVWALSVFAITSIGFTAETPNLTGVVRYEADAARPWRYGRYYVSKTPEHTLAEALVCLRGRGLKGLQPRERPAVVQVDQQDYRFIPETVAIREGDQIRFTNSDAALHNVNAVAGDEPLNVSLTQDGEHLHVFRRAGNSKKPIRIGCAFHSQMQAWIYVFDHPFFAVTGPDGRFAFDGVPPGEYDLEVIHPPGGLSMTRKIVVTEDQPQVVDLRLTPAHLTK